MDEWTDRRMDGQTDDVREIYSGFIMDRYIDGVKPRILTQ